MAARGHYAVRSDSARSPRILSIAAEQDAMEIDRSNRSRDDWTEHHRQCVRNFSAPPTYQSIGAAAFYFDRHPGVAAERTVNRRSFAAKSDARRAARARVAGRLAAGHRR